MRKLDPLNRKSRKTRLSVLFPEKVKEAIKLEIGNYIHSHQGIFLHTHSLPAKFLLLVLSRLLTNGTGTSLPQPIQYLQKLCSDSISVTIQEQIRLLNQVGKDVDDFFSRRHNGLNSSNCKQRLRRRCIAGIFFSVNANTHTSTPHYLAAHTAVLLGKMERRGVGKLKVQIFKAVTVSFFVGHLYACIP